MDRSVRTKQYQKLKEVLRLQGTISELVQTQLDILARLEYRFPNGLYGIANTLDSWVDQACEDYRRILVENGYKFEQNDKGYEVLVEK